MNDFVSIEVLGTMAGCSLIITLLTQVFKRMRIDGIRSTHTIILIMIFGAVIIMKCNTWKPVSMRRSEDKNIFYIFIKSWNTFIR